MRSPRYTFTRDELTRAVTDQDRPDLADCFYARRLDHADGGGTALGFDYDAPADLGLFLVIVATLLNEQRPGDGADFAAAMRFGLPAHPAEPGRGAAYWPRWGLAEATWEQWQDEMNDCLTCRALAMHDDGPCTPHARAPWDARPALAGA